MGRILVIDDEPTLLESIAETISSGGHEVSAVATLPEAERVAQTIDFDLILTDVMLGTDNGIDFLRSQRESGFDGVIVVMTAYGTVESAVEAMQLGADDYLQKPLSLDELDLQVGRWLERRSMARRLALYERMDEANARDGGPLGSSPAWIDALRLAERFSAVPLPDQGSIAQVGLPTILLLGETGCGKGVVARFIHQCVVDRVRDVSGDASATLPFVHVNCASLPSSLVESELFGHERGAFTDAREARPGLFEMAEGGTIFLDEIAEMPLDLQAKILLAVEQGTFRRVGGSREKRVNARVIAATHQLEDRLLADEKLRRDLYYRLSKFTVRIPALRERDGDTLLIATHALDAATRQYGRERLTLSASARNAIERHPWPGNVRELVNCVQRAAIVAEGAQVRAVDLGIVEPDLGTPADAATGGPAAICFDFARGSYSLEAVERELLVQALRFTRGNVSKAARLLEMQRSSLRYRIDRLGLADDVPEVSRR